MYARDNQVWPVDELDKRIWLLLAGRGFGKTRAGAEWVNDRVWNQGAKRIALVGQTPADVRDVMVQGESGLLNIGLPHTRPAYYPSKRSLVWPNGATATVYSAYKPDQLRGPQHDTAWCDEIAAWVNLRETWDNLKFGMRLGDPKICISTTPRPIPFLKALTQDLEAVAISTGSTYENLGNLSVFYQDIIREYEGTSLGEQELNARLLDEMPGALWKRHLLEASRVQSAPQMTHVVIAVDPAVTANEESSETGIVVVGIDSRGHGYVLADRSGQYSPGDWGQVVVDLFDDYEADYVIAEVNQGGDMVRHTVHTVRKTVPFQAVTATRGKRTRAEPVAAMYEQGRIHHVGIFESLEDQMCTWVPGETSPDRMDAMVWGFTKLLLGNVAYNPALLRMGHGGNGKSASHVNGGHVGVNPGGNWGIKKL